MAAPVRMPKPTCLIQNQEGRLSVCPEALGVLRSIRHPVVVVAIVGLYRTGKSYLMNRLAGKRTGNFSPGPFPQKEGKPAAAAVPRSKPGMRRGRVPTAHEKKEKRGLRAASKCKGKYSNTKGIWMWCVPYPDQKDQTLVLLDTEGLGNVDKGDTQNDTWIFALAVLLSSTLVYNSMGTIDQNALEQLHYVTELTERITAKASPLHFFPSFIWALRDFTLQLEPITEDEFLENALKLKKGDSPDVRLFNLPRKCIRFFFPTRKCFIFDRPTSRKNLHRLEQMEERELEPDFVEQADRFCNYIFWTSKEKTLPGGHVVTGHLLAKLVETYVETISSGKVPCMESAVLALAKMENAAAVEEALARYGGLMGQRLCLPTESVPELLGVHAECEKEALQVFMARAFKDDAQRFQVKLMKTLDDRKEEFCRRNEQESSQRCRALLASLSVGLEEKVRSGVYSRPKGHRQFVGDLKDVEGRYRQEPKKGVMAEAALQQFLEGEEAVGRAILQSNTALSAQDKLIVEALVQSEVSRRQQEVLRQKRAELEQKMQDKQRSYEENIQQLKVKMEQDREQLLKEQKKLVDSRLAEQEALLREGFPKEAKRMREEVQRLREQSASVKEPSWMEKAMGRLITFGIIFFPGIAGKAVELISGKAVGPVSDLLRRF
ncbi:guanylate-binding protein 1 isoform X2 [Anolis carolinensis]|uniref:guanylate-binding protein 1 isoform X2 n=1 Tax=Anolis carolinensis TaxID=28377 RepID=UPI002F2B8E25